MPTCSSARWTRASSSSPSSPRLAGPKPTSCADRAHEQLVVGVLEDDADPAPDLGDVLLGDRQPADRHAPGAGGEDAVEVQHQRGLAGAVGAEQGDPLAAVDVQVHAEQRLVAVGVGEGEAADVEDGRHFRGHPAGVAAAQHREVDALAALVGADEQRARGPGEHRPVLRVARGEAPGLARDLHPLHLGGDHVEVADHEGHDLHEQVRQPEPLQPGQQVVRLGGRGEGEAGEHAEGALGEQPPGGEQPGLAQRQAEHLDRAVPGRRTAAAPRRRRTGPRPPSA